MAIISFNKASSPDIQDDLRINTTAVLYVEASLPDLMGATTIHLMGQGSMVNAVVEPVGEVAGAIGHLVAAKRHYMAMGPASGIPSTVHINPNNISYLRPNLPEGTTFWVVRMADGTELRIEHPLPAGL
jgi:hypothetical protein